MWTAINSSTSSSEVMANSSMVRKIAMSVLAAMLSLALLEGCVRIYHAHRRSQALAVTPESLVLSLPQARIRGREIGSQMIVHNIALFARHPSPSAVQRAYAGTSRTKVLRPAWFGIEDAVNASGNSYNEVSYGLLMQLEAVRLQFGNVRTVYVESSLLLRRPAGLRLEEDHLKYVALLDALLPLRDELPGAEKFRQEVQSARDPGGGGTAKLQFVSERSKIRITNALDVEATRSLPVLEDKWIASLLPNGERASKPGPALSKPDQRPEIARDNIKVQRLREIPSWKPWDGLFDMVALWGRQHGIQIVLFQPPVRSDLYRYQVEYGLADHVEDLQRVARQYDVPFIDLNRPSLGFTEDWSLFADEDHMETCPGVILLQGGIEEGLRRFYESGDLLPSPTRSEVEHRYGKKLMTCTANGHGSRV
jgi:hypothetical protein